jgi:hypothetical protein
MRQNKSLEKVRILLVHQFGATYLLTHYASKTMADEYDGTLFSIRNGPQRVEEIPRVVL